jgi:hypothetical protein
MPHPPRALCPRPRSPGRWLQLTALKRAWAIAAVIGSVAGGALQSQTIVPWNSPIPIPLPEGGRRQRDLERQREAAAGPGHMFLIYRWEGPIEPVARFYIQRMGAERDGDLDSTSVRPGGTSNLVYHLQFWTFEDECADSVAPGAACAHWKHAKDLKRDVGLRLPLAPGAWVEHCTFHWFSEDTTGAVSRWTLDVFDSGVTPDWKHYEPSVELIIESDPVAAPTPQAKPGT